LPTVRNCGEREDEEEGRAGGRGVKLQYARGSRASRVCARTSTHPRTGIPAGPVRTLAGLQGRCARWPGYARAPAPARLSLCAAHPADSNSSACAVEISTVGKSQDPAWKDVLDTKGLSAAATILEEYGLSCESDMSLVDEEDLVVLCSKLKPFQSKLLRKWVQGLGVEQRAAAFMKDASAAKNHSSKFNPAPAKIDKERKIATRHVTMSRVASTVSRSKVHD
jgi:hypothetical protein